MNARRYPLSFWLVAGSTAAIGLAAFALRGSDLPLLNAFVPSIFLSVTLCNVATFVLLTIIIAKSRRDALLPLSVLFLANALIFAAIFLAMKIPGMHTSLIFPGNKAVSWLFAAGHLVVSLCALSYVLKRGSDVLLSPPAMRRAQSVLLPAVFVAAIFGAGLLLIDARDLPRLVDAAGFATPARTVLVSANLSMTLVVLAICIRLLRPKQPDGFDLALILSLFAGAIELVSQLAIGPRNAPWSLAVLSYLLSSSFVLVAVLRYLIERVAESVRVEAEALRVEADAFERNAAVEASLIKSRFVALVSHELRTPLGAIVGTAELLETTALSDRQRQLTAAMRTSTRSLHRIVDDLLDFSRIEAGRLELVSEPYDLPQTIDDLVVLFREQARKKDLTYHAFVDPSLPRALVGDQTRLKQILQNLVTNALRFTSEGGVHIDVVPGEQPDGAPAISFSVVDTGCGIDARLQEHIFDAFVQADASTARRFGGTGLGLSIARHLVGMMGGRMSLVSALGAGSTFSFTIPLRPFGGADLTSPLHDTSVLVVESDPDLRALMRRYVQGWEMRSTEVESVAGAHAIMAAERAIARPFDVVIVGSGIPANDAVDFVRQAFPDCAAASAHAILLRDERVDPSTAGFAAYAACIIVPLRQSELFDAIMRVTHQGFTESARLTISGVPARQARPELVLVAEDNEVNQLLLVAQLEHLGFQSDVVSDGKSAVAAATAKHYDLIFMDCQMPELDGFEAVRQIRDVPNLRKLPIIAVSANVLAGYRETCIAAGMQDYLAKPALIGPIAAVIDRWLGPGNTLTAAALHPPEIAAPPPPPSEARKRLAEIFHGDQERVDRLIAMSHETLLDGATVLGAALLDRDGEVAARTAHRMKGVALEIGMDSLADIARAIQTAAQASAWDEAEQGHAHFLSALRASTELESNRA